MSLMQGKHYQYFPDSSSVIVIMPLSSDLWNLTDYTVRMDFNTGSQDLQGW